MRMTAFPVRLANSIAASAVARTSVTEPADWGKLREPKTLTESRMTSSEGSLSSVAKTSSMSEAVRRRMEGFEIPRRMARSEIWAAFSSAEAYRAVLPFFANQSAIWMERVDFPMPGSPERRMSDPGTMPPQRRLFNSDEATGIRRLASDFSFEIVETGSALPDDAESFEAPPFLGSFGASTREFHSPHAGHFPVHFGWVWEQLEQRNIVIAVTYMYEVYMRSPKSHVRHRFFRKFFRMW